MGRDKEEAYGGVEGFQVSRGNRGFSGFAGELFEEGGRGRSKMDLIFTH